MFKLNPESKTGFPWSFFVGKKKKKIGPSSHTQTIETFQQVLTQYIPFQRTKRRLLWLASVFFVLRSSGILLSECFGFF